MEQHVSAVEYHEHHGGGTKEVKKVTIILTVITLIELALGYCPIFFGWNEENPWRHFTKGVILILMLAKGFYIAGYFMHLKMEIRNMIMTVCIPLFLFVWFIIAFLYDGKSYNNNRNTYTPYYKVHSEQKAPGLRPEDEKHGQEKSKSPEE
jgi:cytochrome c oxidase subunit 4